MSITSYRSAAAREERAEGLVHAGSCRQEAGGKRLLGCMCGCTLQRSAAAPRFAALLHSRDCVLCRQDNLTAERVALSAHPAKLPTTWKTQEIQVEPGVQCSAVQAHRSPSQTRSRGTSCGPPHSRFSEPRTAPAQAVKDVMHSTWCTQKMHTCTNSTTFFCVQNSWAACRGARHTAAGRALC
jgi:hypothetical protein